MQGSVFVGPAKNLSKGQRWKVGLIPNASMLSKQLRERSAAMQPSVARAQGSIDVSPDLGRPLHWP